MPQVEEIPADTKALSLFANWRVQEALAMVALAGLLGITLGTQIRLTTHPAEDAAILLRYSKHLANDNGIVWNIGETPMDGATDFLYMAAVAGMAKLGFGVEPAARLLALAFHAFTIALVFYFGTRLAGFPIWAAFISAGYLAIGTGLRYVEAFFGTTVFAFFVAGSWCAAFVLVEGRRSSFTRLIFALTGLMCGLVRPEGVLVFVLLLSAVVVRNGLRDSRPLLRQTVLVFGLVGFSYLTWRYWYFGHFLPTPYLKKGGGTFHFNGLTSSMANVLRLSMPFVSIHVLATIGVVASLVRARLAKGASFNTTGEVGGMRGYERAVLFFTIPIVGYVLMWGLLSDEMNYFMRFQYPILPVILLSWFPLARLAIRHYGFSLELGRLTKSDLVTLAVVFAVALFAYQYRKNSYVSNWRDGRYDVGTSLQEFADKAYTMAVTEAGLLPFYSEWKALDAWGLNDRHIAEYGVIDAAYLDRWKPEIIFFHAYQSPLAAANGRRDEWTKMNRVLKSYAETNDYILAASFGVHVYDAHYYYVRRDFPDSDRVVRLIRGTRYFWWSGGECVNFAVVSGKSSS